jgi:cytochrome c
MDRQRGWMIGGAIGAAVVVALGGGWAGTLLVPSEYPAESAYKVTGMDEPPVDLAALQRSWPAGVDPSGGWVRLAGYMKKVEHGAVIVPAPADAGIAVAAPQLPHADLGTLLAAADMAKGKAATRVCSTCHSFDQGGPNRTGPDLWGIVGRRVAGKPGFSYSTAFMGQTGNWTYERLDHYLTSPARAVPGNKMAFGGIRNAADRANVLAYLGSLNSSPAPFPAPKLAEDTGKTHPPSPS